MRSTSVQRRGHRRRVLVGLGRGRYHRTMVSVVIQLSESTLERAKVLAQRSGRSLDVVIGEITSEALEQEFERGDGVDPAWHDELVQRIEGFENGTAKARPAADVFADIRARFAR